MPLSVEQQREANRKSYQKHKESRQAYYRELSRKRREADPKGYLEYAKEWLENNRDKVNLLRRMKRAEGKDPSLYDKDWRLIKKERQPIKGVTKKERAASSYARWAKENPHKCAALAAARRAKKKNATPKWADLKKIGLFYLEAVEKTKTTGIPHEVDHYYPLNSKVVCGLHCEFNLRVITAEENIRKHNKCP